MSIRFKLGLVISAAILCTTIAASLAFLSLQHASIRQAEEEKIGLWKRNIANIAAESRLGNDPLMLLAYLHDLRRLYKDFLHLRVNSGGQWEDVGKTLKAPDPALARIETVRVPPPAAVKGPPIEIEVWFSRAVIYESERQAWAKLTHNMLIAGGIVAFAGMLLGLLLGWTMTRRILLIASTLRKLGAGQIEARMEMQEGSDELANLAQDVNEMADKLQELNKLKRSFVASVTHELRIPLGIIEKHVKALLAKPARLSAEDCDHANCVKNSASRLGHVMTDLLDLAKIEHGKLRYDPRPMRLTELVEDTVLFFLPKAEAAGIALSRAVEPGITVCADQDLITSVLTNLISNALKFTRPGGTIRVELKSVDQGAECSVTDSGVGISQATLARALKPIEHARNPLRAAGAGLATSKSIIDMHRGRIGVVSEVGRGSRFYFFLPFFAPPAGNSAAAPAPAVVDLFPAPPQPRQAGPALALAGFALVAGGALAYRTGLIPALKTRAKTAAPADTTLPPAKPAPPALSPEAQLEELKRRAIELVQSWSISDQTVSVGQSLAAAAPHSEGLSLWLAEKLKDDAFQVNFYGGKPAAGKQVVYEFKASLPDKAVTPLNAAAKALLLGKPAARRARKKAGVKPKKAHAPQPGASPLYSLPGFRPGYGPADGPIAKPAEGGPAPAPMKPADAKPAQGGDEAPAPDDIIQP